MLTGSDERSSRFLDPVALENFHNEGRTSSIGAQVTFSPGKNLFSGSAQGGRESYDVPHNREQEEAGQDQRQRVSQVLLSGSWQRVLVRPNGLADVSSTAGKGQPRSSRRQAIRR